MKVLQELFLRKISRVLKANPLIQVMSCQSVTFILSRLCINPMEL